MKNIEINTKAVKKLFAAGLLTFTMTGCAGNGEPVKDDKPKEDKVEEKVDEKYLTESETELLKAGDILDYGKFPDRKVLEEMGLDYLTICENYLYTTENLDEEPKKLDDRFSKQENFEGYYDDDAYVLANGHSMSGTLNENNEVEWSYIKPVQLKIIEIKYYVDNDGKTWKVIPRDGDELLVEPLCKDVSKELVK